MTDRETLKKLRAHVKKAYHATTDHWPHLAWRQKEPFQGRKMEVDSYPTDWLERQRDLFARLA